MTDDKDHAQLAAELRRMADNTAGPTYADTLLAAAEAIEELVCSVRSCMAARAQRDALHSVVAKLEAQLAERDKANKELHDKYCEETWQRRRGRKPGDGWNV